MYEKSRRMFSVLLILMIGFISAGTLYAHRISRIGGHRALHRHAPFWDNLDEAQKETLETLIQSMKEQNADPEAIHEAVHNKLKTWDIDLPERPPHRGRMENPLNGEQKAEIERLIESMKARDASRKEIRDAVHEKMAAWGIERPERPEKNQSDETEEPTSTESPKVKSAAHPNPFNPETSIAYELKEPADVKITIFNTQGQIVRQWSRGYQESGQYKILWDGKSESGESVPSGTYIYKIQTDDQVFSGHMLLMK